MGSLTISNVTKTFGSTEVLKGINIDIADGEFLILVGPSGCGKSTLMNTIAGLEEVTTGQLLLAGEDVTERSPKDRDIAMVFQSYALYPTMNVARNISFGLEMRGVPKQERDQRVQEVSTLLQINHLLDRKPSQLSGGQRQRVAMGRALARSPRVYLFDEPLSNLDAKLRVEMRTEIKKLHKRLGTTIVYVTHDQIEAMTLADRIAVMKDGVVQQLGTPNEIYDNPANQFVAGFMGSPPMNFVPCEVNSDGSLAIDTSSHSLSLTIPQSSTLKAQNISRVILGLRPEMLTEPKPERAGDSVMALEMDFDVTEPMGADTIAIGEWNGIEILARLSPEAGLRAGKSTPVQVDLSKVVLFDPESGERIR
ncbi:MAG: sn-glycerol-3-phosphate ABC transporter ATP-binding protein UgpC [Litorivicinaceae bacterium]|jgi:multiple sugar transport system ATP-binding protein|nr:sn-glycerol-3-phosphate ABC transporter ATP-binding protein UgpC [Litorivicinaceae bacterium]MDF1783858.1 sn-glycerol-3-phosphate ABC transporter ATP-binding protein UgpC [Litorivicinaceae bacterium]NBR75494.1 sn-glycerol-3-phosphate ABC transporter ATP-binding protein UgpC [Gammaproteobacteria bacterium]